MQIGQGTGPILQRQDYPRRHQEEHQSRIFLASLQNCLFLFGAWIESAPPSLLYYVCESPLLKHDDFHCCEPAYTFAKSNPTSASGNPWQNKEIISRPPPMLTSSKLVRSRGIWTRSCRGFPHTFFSLETSPFTLKENPYSSTGRATLGTKCDCTEEACYSCGTSQLTHGLNTVIWKCTRCML